MAVGGNVEVRSLTDFQAVNNLYVSGTILTSGSIQLGFSLVDGDSDLILSSSATSRVVVSGTLDVLDQLLVQGVPVGGSTAVTGSRDFFVQNILDVSGTIRNPVGHLVLSSSNGSTITVSGSLVVMGPQSSATTLVIGNNGAISTPRITITDNNEGSAAFTNGASLGMGQGSSIVWSNNVSGLGGSRITRIRQLGTGSLALSSSVDGFTLTSENGHLILSSSVGSSVAVSSTLEILGDAFLPAARQQYWYNTADRTTNYERLNIGWSGNIAKVQTQKGGSGNNRVLDLLSSWGHGWRIQDSTINVVGSPTNAIWNISPSDFSTIALGGLISNSTNPSVRLTNVGSFGATTAVQQRIASVEANIGQGGTAGYTAFLINPTELSIGTGTRYLLDAQIGGVSRLIVDNVGRIIGTSGSLILSSSVTSRVFVSGALQVPYTNDSANPTIRLGDDNVGLSAQTSNQISFHVGSATPARVTNDYFGASAGPVLVIGFSPAPTVASILPNVSDTNTGIGWNGNDILAVKAGGRDMITVMSSSAVMLVAISGNLSVPNDGTDRSLFSEQFGNTAVAFSHSSFAAGYGARAMMQSASAIGTFASASNVGAMAIGYTAIAAGADGIALGRNARASSGISIGRQAGNSSINNTGIVIGAASVNNDATGLIILGAGSSATSQAIMIGHGSQATGANSIAIGNSSFNGRTNAISIGNGQSSSDLAGNGSSVAIGDDSKFNTNAVSVGAVAGGDSGAQMGVGAVAVGHTARAHGQAGVAIGQNASAQESGSLAFGLFASSSFRNSIAFGSASFAHTASIAVFGTASSPIDLWMWGKVVGGSSLILSSTSGPTFVSGNLIANSLTASSGELYIGTPGGNINLIRTTANGAFTFQRRSDNIFNALTFGTEISTNPGLRFLQSPAKIEVMEGTYSSYRNIRVGTLEAQDQVALSSSNNARVVASSGHLILTSSIGSAIAMSGAMKLHQVTAATMPAGSDTLSGSIVWVSDLKTAAIYGPEGWTRIVTGSAI